MRNPQDTKNILLVNHYVGRHFGFSSNNKRLFRERVLYSPDKAPEYMEMIGNAPDLRVRFPVTPSVVQSFDRGWDIFANKFHNFVSHKSVTYEDFINGKIAEKKNIVKMFKALYNFYIKEERAVDFLVESRDLSGIDLEDRALHYFSKKYGPVDDFSYQWRTQHDRLIIKLGVSGLRKIYASYYCPNEEGENCYKDDYLCIYVCAEQIKVEDILTQDDINLGIKNIITYWMDYAGKIGFPKKDMELVISCNPADMFMASTSEKWGSCINVDSDYAEAYWAGLPGAIIDKNRAIAYITDGQKKEYNGIVVDRFIARTWLLTMRSKKYHRSFIQVVREYPISVNFAGLLNSTFEGKYLFDNHFPTGITGGSIISKYKFETLYHNVDGYVKKLCYIYLDTTSIKFAKKGKAAYFPYDYAYHKLGGGDYPDITVRLNLTSHSRNTGIMFDEPDGLSGVIDGDYAICPIEKEDDYENDGWEDEVEEEAW